MDNFFGWMFFFFMGALGTLAFSSGTQLEIMGYGVFALIGFFGWLYFLLTKNPRKKKNG